MTLVRFLDNAFGAEETCFFDTFFLLVALTDFTVFFEEDFFAADFFAAAFFDGAFFAARFLADLTGFTRLTDAAERREDARALDFLALDARALDFLALFFLLTAFDDLFAAAFFAGISRASEGTQRNGRLYIRTRLAEVVRVESVPRGRKTADHPGGSWTSGAGCQAACRRSTTTVV